MQTMLGFTGDEPKGYKQFEDFIHAIKVVDSPNKGHFLMTVLAEHNVFLCDHITKNVKALDLFYATNALVDIMYEEWIDYVLTHWSVHYT